MLTPFDTPDENTPESRYNHSHKITRSVIERCNGVLKGRFRCISSERTLRYSPAKVGAIVISCGVLHNMCIRAGVAAENILLDDFEIEEQIVGYENIQNAIFAEGIRIRQEVVNRYFMN